MARLDVDRPCLARVGAETEIVHGNDVGVIETEARWLRHEVDAAHVTRRDVWRAFLGGAVNINGHELTVPVQLLRGVGVIIDVDDDPLTFGEAEEGPRKLSVVEGGRDNVLRRQFNQSGADAQAIVRLFRHRRDGKRRHGARQRQSRGTFQERAAIHGILHRQVTRLARSSRVEPDFDSRQVAGALRSPKFAKAQTTATNVSIFAAPRA